MGLYSNIIMSELVTTYLLTDLDQPMPMAREEFYEEQIKVFRKTGKPTRAVEIAQVLLFTPDLEIILQKRSSHKNHNPGKLDKTVGGHITWGDTPTYTVMAETLQELAIPAFVLDSDENFNRTFKLLHQFLNNSALVQFIDSRTVTLEKIFNKELVGIANKYYFYLGIYGGSIKPMDKEASGVLYYKYENLIEEIEETPELFTADLKFFLDKYREKIKEFLNNARPVLTKK